MNTELIARLDTYATCDDYQRDIEAAVMALKAAQAEIERLKGEEYLYQLHFERACRAKYEALALLAALEQLEPVGRLTGRANEELDGTHGYAAAGAAPVATAQPDDCANTPYDEGPFTTAQPSQARELPKHPVALSRDDTEHGVYYYKASEVDAIIAAINAKEQPHG